MSGYEFSSQAVSWLQRDVLLFANSIGATADELQFLYVSDFASPFSITHLIKFYISRNWIPASRFFLLTL